MGTTALRRRAAWAAAATVALLATGVPGVPVGHAAGGPTVTIDQAADQADPSPDWNIRFDVRFSAPVTGFDDEDVVLTLPPGMEVSTVVTGADAVYVVTVSISKGYGTVSAGIGPGAAVDVNGAPSDASTSTDDSVAWTSPGLPLVTATVEQAADQPDPTTEASVRFDIVFSEPVLDFGTADLDVGGTAAPDHWLLDSSPDGTTWVVTVLGMSQAGTVTVAVPAGVVWTTGRNTNAASTSVDATVSYDNRLVVTTPGGGVTVEITEGGSLSELLWAPLSVPAPDGWSMPWGELSFRAITTGDSEFVTFVITLPSDAAGFFKLDGGAWAGVAWDGSTGAIVAGNTITVRVQDNGRGDADPTPGVVLDPAAPAVRAVLVRTGSGASPLLWWAVTLLLLGTVAIATARRRSAACPPAA